MTPFSLVSLIIYILVILAVLVVLVSFVAYSSVMPCFSCHDHLISKRRPDPRCDDCIITGRFPNDTRRGGGKTMEPDSFKLGWPK